MSHAAPRILRGLIAGATATALASFQVAPAYAAGMWSGMPAATGSPSTGNASTLPLTGNEIAPFDTLLSGGANPQTEVISTNQIAAFVGAQPANYNFLIGGDATQNLFQRGTTGSSVTTTTTFGGPDRFFYWSGASTAMTVSRDSTAADLVGTTQYGFKMARTSGQTGVVQVCMAQEITSQNSYALRGQTVELSYDAAAGANFSAASSQMTAYISYGTGTDEGAASYAKGLNGGGGGSAGWTGQANATAAVTTITTTPTRYSAVATIPSTATEVAIALCFTPVGTAGTNDYIAFGNIQLARAPSLAAYVSTTVGYTSSTINGLAFQRRLATIENALQYAYYYQLNDPAATVHIGPCQVVTANTVVRCMVPLPAMRAAPTITAPGSNTAFAVTAADGSANVCTATAVTGSATVLATGGWAQIDCTPTSNIAVTVPSWFIGDAQSFSIKASAEMS